MLNEKFNRLRQMLIRHEGLSLKPYRCPAGRLTIGVGRNIEDVGVTELEAMLMLSNDMARVEKEAIGSFPWFKSLSIARQDVVLNMLFNMGLARFKGFKKMIAALIDGNFNKAADEMLDSKWASQVGIRAKELASMMRSGRYS